MTERKRYRIISGCLCLLMIFAFLVSMPFAKPWLDIQKEDEASGIFIVLAAKNISTNGASSRGPWKTGN